MTGTRQLPPVWDVEIAADALPGTVADAPSRLDELRAMRHVMAKHVDNENTLARDLAALIGSSLMRQGNRRARGSAGRSGTGGERR